MTVPVSNVMLVITTYTPVAPPASPVEVDIAWCLELADSVDVELQPARSKYIFETLAVHPTRKFAASIKSDQPARRSMNSPYFRLLKARVRRVHQSPARPAVSNLKIAVNPTCRAYLTLNEKREFSAQHDSKKLRELICTMSEIQKTPAAVPQDAIRTAHDPARTVRLQPFFVAQPIFSPA